MCLNEHYKIRDMILKQSCKSLFLLIISFFITSSTYSQSNNYLEISNKRLILDSQFNSQGKIFGYEVKNCKNTKMAVPEYFVDLAVASPLTGELIYYLDYYKIDSMLVDLDMGYFDFDSLSNTDLLQLKIVLQNESCLINKFKLYLIYDKIKRFQLSTITDTQDLLNKFGKPKNILINEIEFQDSKFKKWELPHTILWRIK